MSNINSCVVMASFMKSQHGFENAQVLAEDKPLAWGITSYVSHSSLFVWCTWWKAPIQYKDDILPISETPLWR